MSFCSKCGAQLTDAGAKFCPGCGAPVGQSAANNTAVQTQGYEKADIEQNKVMAILATGRCSCPLCAPNSARPRKPGCRCNRQTHGALSTDLTAIFMPSLSKAHSCPPARAGGTFGVLFY